MSMLMTIRMSYLLLIIIINGKIKIFCGQVHQFQLLGTRKLFNRNIITNVIKAYLMIMKTEMNLKNVIKK